MVQLTYLYMTTVKATALTIRTFVGKVISPFFNTLSRFLIVFLPRNKHVLILWLHSLSAVVLEPPKIKSVTASTFFSSICYEVMGLDALVLLFWMLSFKPGFSLSSFTLIKRLFNSSSLSAVRVVSSAYLRLLIFLTAILTPVCETFRRKESLKWIKKDGEVLAKWNRDWSAESSIQRFNLFKDQERKNIFLQFFSGNSVWPRKGSGQEAPLSHFQREPTLKTERMPVGILIRDVCWGWPFFLTDEMVTIIRKSS